MYAISPTDIDWFHYLRATGHNSKINFWTPTPWNISKLEPGDKLYFMLKSPIRKIGGYGQFLEYKNMTVNEAWSHFGFKNGCSSKQEFVERLDKYKSNRSTDERSVLESEIGCIVLNDAEFYDDNQFKDISNYDIDFSRFIVKIKYFYANDPLTAPAVVNTTKFELVPVTTEKLRNSRTVTERKGQSNFRAKISQAYSNKCCVTQESTPELLEAAHIQPYIDERSNHINNGLLLRIDIHKLFDNGLLFIDKDYKIHVSPEVISEYYQGFHGNYISLPSKDSSSPSPKALQSRIYEFRNGQ